MPADPTMAQVQPVQSPRMLERIHRERREVYRTLAPAWPVALVGALAVALFAGMDQARDALLFTVSSQEWTSVLSFAGALGLFTLALMQSALQLMSVTRRNLYGAPDTGHPSIGLRIGAAFGLGIWPALVLIAIVMVSLVRADRGGVWIDVAALAAVIVVVLLSAGLSAAILPAFNDRNLQRLHKRVVERSESGGASQGDKLLRNWIFLRVRANRVRWAFKTARLSIILSALILLVTALETIADEPRFAVALAILSVAGAALVFVQSYDKWMRVVGVQNQKQLVVDARMQALLRGWTFIWIVLCLGAFWASYFTPSVYAVLGPATALLMGLFLVLSALGWCVRTALTPAEAAVRLTRRAGPSEIVIVAGQASWWLQQVLAAHRVLGFGVALLALDWLISLFEWAWPKDATGALIWWPLATGGAVFLACILGLAAFALAGRIGRRPDSTPAPVRLRPEPDDVPRIGTLVLLLPFLLATLGEDRRPPYQLPEASAAQASARPSLEVAARQWLAPREGQQDITAIVVLAEGGGIRSAVHITQLLSEIDKRRPERRLLRDAYALAGVSGGAVGLSTFLATNAESSDPATRARLMDRVLGADHLSPLISGMFGSDMPSMFVPIDVLARLERMQSPQAYMDKAPKALLPGRAQFFESSLDNAWTEATANAPVNWLSQPLSKVVRKAAGDLAPPIVMFPTFGVEGGIRAVASNAMFGDCSVATNAPFVDVLSCLNLRRGGEQLAPLLDMPLRSAAHLSARFPGSNPPAIFDACEFERDPRAACRLRRLRFIDGGYFDNSGSSAAREAVDALVVAARDAQALDRLHIIVVHAYFRDERAIKDSWRPASAFNEILAPFDGVWSARSSSGQLPIASFCHNLMSLAGAAENRETGRHVDVCGLLSADRTWSDQARDPLPTCFVVPVDETAGKRPRIDWISAPVNNHRDPANPGHFLLGWSLQKLSRERLAETTVPTAKGIVDFLKTRDDTCALRVFEASKTGPATP